MTTPDPPSHTRLWRNLEALSELRVLHLEDDELDHLLVASELERGGLPWKVVVRRADGEAEFRAALEELQPHIVVSDFSLPGYDGLSAYAAARAYDAYLPFIIVTGAMGEEVAVETLRSGVTDYVLKQRLERLVPAMLRALSETAERVRREHAEAEVRGLNLTLRARLEEVERLNRVAGEQRQQLEETARQLEAALSAQRTFLAETSHELRTPLTALLGYLRRAERETNGSQTIKDAVRVTENMTRLVNDLLQLSRGELVQSVEMHFVRLSELLCGVGRDYGVRVEVPPGLEIVADPQRLSQVFVNLVTNAVRVAGSRDLVHISAQSGEDEVLVDVIDRGPGISDEVKPRIFDKFYRGREAGSAGLGLTIAAQVVGAHHGHIEVLDTPGGGATFRVHLPALEDED